MFAKILAVLVILIGVFAGVAAMQPDTFNVTRTATINASPAVVFEQVNNLRKWDAWSPWAKLDPNAKMTYEGPEAGVGARMVWSGNFEVGEGSLTIVESRPNELVRYNLDFVKPFKGTSSSEITFKPEGNQTAVSWNMTGNKDFIMKAMGLIMNCEKMMSEQFDKGLANLKTVAESAPQPTVEAPPTPAPQPPAPVPETPPSTAPATPEAAPATPAPGAAPAAPAPTPAPATP